KAAALEAYEPLVEPARRALDARSAAEQDLAIAEIRRNDLQVRYDANPESPSTEMNVREARSKVTEADLQKTDAYERHVETNNRVAVAEKGISQLEQGQEEAAEESLEAKAALKRYFEDHFEPLRSAVAAIRKTDLWS